MNYSIIEESELFKGIDSNEIKAMMKCLEPQVEFFHKNDFIVLEGHDLAGIGLVLSGQVVILKESYSGDGLVLRKINKGNIFGEVAVFSNIDKWPASVQATKDTEVVFFRKEKIKGQCPYLCPRHSKLIKNLLYLISIRAAYLNKKMDYLSIKSMRGKIAAYLWDEYKKNEALSFRIKFNRKEMADYLNVSRPSMSRELGRMKEEKVIDFHKSSFKILDITALKSMAMN
ncbi:MAG: Crp/Fnr family transcriptional regulator [Clostridia bacterium]